MPPKTRDFFADPDYVLWDQNEAKSEAWRKSVLQMDVYRGIVELIRKYRPGEPAELHRAVVGSFNIVFRLEYKDGKSAVLRVPAKHRSHFPEEKIRYEVAMMKYIRAHTTIPVPEVYAFGTAAENPLGIGPFIVMEYIDHHRSLGDALSDPNGDPKKGQILYPDISEKKLEYLYEQMAAVLLQLYNLDFSRIGSLVLDENKNGRMQKDVASVAGRPLILNINAHADWTSMPRSLLPSGTYTNAEAWYSAMADMHMLQLIFQRNDAVEDEDDVRDKYVARRLFGRLVSSGSISALFNQVESSELQRSAEGSTSIQKTGTGPPFKLFSEDLRPTNVLVNEHDKIVAVVDWEFAYAAPAQFARDPPWWLLLRQPQDWVGGIEAFINAYEPRLGTFVGVLRRCEARSGTLHASHHGHEKPLSQHMQESWDKKLWIHSICLRDTWLFDHLFWKYVDPLFYGSNEDCDYKKRLILLTEKEKDAMERLVKMKMEEKEEEKVVEWEPERAKALLATFVCD
ncbi:phosphotransferase family protein [Microdochium trichocladiopsis]|uniref:Phosphotransferase family protein n=1 Tax=Microdochium trichocladiopsis TaxID=1682393 RepID=A0A9P8YCR6_9PEZI|nr:phosphotransferase family protein [Microdochium trichocladiopsis]KAH7037055.1 phosphotransferase family protein [Microdochium trichocladiopsis]